MDQSDVISSRKFLMENKLSPMYCLFDAVNTPLSRNGTEKVSTTIDVNKVLSGGSRTSSGAGRHKSSDAVNPPATSRHLSLNDDINDNVDEHYQLMSANSVGTSNNGNFSAEDLVARDEYYRDNVV